MEKPSILVVEDEGVVALSLELALQSLGYSVCGTAGSSEDALRQAIDAAPDLVLVDIRLRGTMDGIELAQVLRTRREVPVIFVTGNTDDSTLERALSVTPAAFLHKPYSERALRSAIQVALHQHRTNLELRERLERESNVDPITELFNRRYLEIALERELKAVVRHQQPASVLMLDVDHFKRFNDAHGHLAGDAALRAVGSVLRSSIRPGDIACRYGGEELTTILPQTDGPGALAVAERLRASIAALEIPLEGGDSSRVTVSIGVASAPGNGVTLESVLGAADAALYRAKQQGRDRAVAAH